MQQGRAVTLKLPDEICDDETALQSAGNEPQPVSPTTHVDPWALKRSEKMAVGTSQGLVRRQGVLRVVTKYVFQIATCVHS